MCRLVFYTAPVQLEVKLVKLRGECTVKVSERDSLQEKSKEIALKLDRAEALTSSLGDEQVQRIPSFLTDY